MLSEKLPRLVPPRGENGLCFAKPMPPTLWGLADEVSRCTVYGPWALSAAFQGVAIMDNLTDPTRFATSLSRLLGRGLFIR